jgi:hypothetical protein
MIFLMLLLPSGLTQADEFVGICDDIADWENIGCSSAGIDAMTRFGNDLLESWGFDPVDFTTDPIPDDPGEPTAAQYDPSTGLIHLDPEFLCGEENGVLVAGIVGHEAFHAAYDQAGWPDSGEEGVGPGIGAYDVGIDIATQLDTKCISSESGSVELDFPWVYDTGGVRP